MSDLRTGRSEPDENALADEPEGLDPKQLAAGEALLERLNLARADLAK